MGAYIKYISALLLLSSNGIVAGHISLPSYEIVFLRTFIGSIFLVSVFFLTGGRPCGIKDRRQFFFLALSGISMGLDFMLLYEAYARIGVSVATLANYCGPVIVIALAPLFRNEKLTLFKCVLFAVVLCGMLLVSGVTTASGGLSWGLVCGLLSAVMYALMVIFNQMAYKISGLENAAFQQLFCLITVSIFIFSRNGIYFPFSRADAIPIFTLGIVNTGIACYLYFGEIAKLPSATVAICGYLEPLSAVILSAVFLHERLTPAQIAGAVLIIGGAALYTLLSVRRDRR